MTPDFLTYGRAWSWIAWILGYFQPYVVELWLSPVNQGVIELLTKVVIANFLEDIDLLSTTTMTYVLNFKHSFSLWKPILFIKEMWGSSSPLKIKENTLRVEITGFSTYLEMYLVAVR